MRVELRAFGLLLLFSSRVLAQDYPQGDGDQPLPMPPVINNAPLEPAPVEAPQPQRPWVEECFARTAPGWYGTTYWRPRPVVVISGGGSTVASGGGNGTHDAVAVGSGGSTNSGGASSGGGGGEAALFIAVAVVVAAVIPFIFYALDDDASPDVEGRFHCPGVDLDLRGGVETDTGGGTSAPFVARVRATSGYFGVMAQFDVAPWSSSRTLVNSTVAAMVRLAPKQHVEIAVSAGYRAQVLRGQWRPGFEVAIPHEYVFSRDGAAHFGLEVRPALFYSGVVDLSLDLGLRIPLGPLVSLTLGARVSTYDGLHTAGAGAQLGLGFKL